MQPAQTEAEFRLINLDAWSDGQQRSKLWLCQVLEKHWTMQNSNFWIYGSWYGTLPQFILMRERLSVSRFKLFDIDKDALEVSQKINLSWQLNQSVNFHYELKDCHKIETIEMEQEKPDLIINTSCEHFNDFTWFDNLPKGQKFLLQSTDMFHPTHILRSESLKQFIANLKDPTAIYYSGELEFNYPDKKFKRFMVYGEK